MKNLLLSAAILTIVSMSVFAQKGVDSQTEKITEKTGTNETTNVSRSINWGRDKTKVREPLANPYKLASRRDVLVQTIQNVLQEMKLVVDDSASKPNDGIIITQPYVFAKGAVITKSELIKYGIIPSSDIVWRSGRYSLRIDVESIDGVQNNISVMAKIEGKSENSFISEWTSLQTTGAVEDKFLAKLIEAVTGKSVDEPQPQ